MSDNAPTAQEAAPIASEPAATPPKDVAEDSDPDFDDLDGS